MFVYTTIGKFEIKMGVLIAHKWYILHYHDFCNFLISAHFDYYKWKEILDVARKVLHLTRYTHIKELSKLSQLRVWFFHMFYILLLFSFPPHITPANRSHIVTYFK